jgi:hypothetical protein
MVQTTCSQYSWWQKNLIESHLAETPTETTSDSEDDQINDNEQSDSEPDLTLDRDLLVR